MPITEMPDRVGAVGAGGWGVGAGGRGIGDVVYAVAVDAVEMKGDSPLV